MFSLSNNGNDPISYSDQQAYKMPFFNDIISNSKQDVPPPSSFCHLPSPLFTYDQLELEDRSIFLQQNYDLLLHQQPLRDTATSTTLSQSTVVYNMADSNKDDDINQLITEICNRQSNNSTDQIPRKRSSKRDRHSKINTAQGPRDRRMRLSLKVAREFFDLQDKLRFDKASKTVEWLLTQAKTEIKKLSSGVSLMNDSCSVGTKSASSTSECEVLSEIDIGATNKGRSVSKGKSSLFVKKERRTTSGALRKTAFSPFAKESREKARARARERTKEKLGSLRIDELKPCHEVEAKNNELNQFAGCWSPFDTGDQESGTHNINPSLEAQLAEVEVPIYQEQEELVTTEGMIDEIVVNMGKWSPPFPNDHLHCNGIPQEVSSKEKFLHFPR
ncbi:unnamed protein product [Dovyalis caffra]|uniref:Uncharacterized protein n=1 Tax=Dovyalis caffra TaxID=77055 RepID=A0AAV1SH23_9ROSI|nr:unnamed protein product [Dovyalis caffra]